MGPEGELGPHRIIFRLSQTVIVFSGAGWPCCSATTPGSPAKDTLGFAMCCVQSLHLCLTLRSPMDCSPSGSSDQGIFQARILEQGAISSSRGSPDSGIGPAFLVLTGRFFTTKPPGKPHLEKCLLKSFACFWLGYLSFDHWVLRVLCTF